MIAGFFIENLNYSIKLYRQIHIPENGSVRLHGLLHVKPNLSSGLRTVRCSDNLLINSRDTRQLNEYIPNFVQELNALNARVFWNRPVRFSWRKSISDVMCSCTTENDNVQ